MKKICARMSVLIAAVMLSVFALSSCDKKTDGDAATYKIGAVFSVTGGASFLGEPEKKTAEMIVERVNKNGGINGKKVELIVMDSEGDATKASLHVKKLMTKDNVLAVIGPSTSGNSIAVIPLAEKNETPLVSCALSYKIVHNDETGKPYKWVFKVAQSDSQAVDMIYTYLVAKGIKKIALMTVTTGYGASGREEMIRLAPKYALEIVAEEKYGPKDTDMTVQLTKIKSFGPEAIINWSVGPTQVTVVRNWKDLGMVNIKLVQSAGFGSLKNVELAAGTAEGVLVPLGAVNIAGLLPADHTQKAVTMEYLNEYQGKYNEAVSTFGGHAWDSLNLVLKAIEKVGGDKAKIRDEIENTKGFVGQHGVFNMSADDHNGLDKTAYNMVVVKNGTWALAE
ncbi:ABC transporter substrate-binding protein [bacterium]|nr:ABC transporter substrate-binding protein [bacterium]